MDDFISKETIVEAHNINNDTISRWAAIEAMKKQCEELLKGLDKNSNVYGIMSASTGIMICAVGQLPPAQPERTPMQELLDVTADRDYWKAQCHSYEMTINRLTESAQPERIKGHWICDRSWSEGVGMGESYGHYWKCDKCGHLEQGDWGECGCNFCSNCGSDNREVTE